MEIDQETLKDNPEIFLDEEDMKDDSEDESNTKSNSNSSIELNDLSIKENDYLLIGIYGNGSALIKASFFLESKKQNNSFKVKFMYQDKNQNKKKVLTAELHQYEINSKNILVLYTKSGMTNKNYKYILDYLLDNKILFKNVIIFNGKTSDSFLSLNKVENSCYYLKSRKCNYGFKECNALPSPNYISGFSGYLFTWCDYNEVPCCIITSVFKQYDIGIDSIKAFKGCLETFEFLNGRIDDEYLKKNDISVEKINSVFNEFNQIKSSYFS